MINDVKVFAYRRQATACTEWTYEEKRKSLQEGLFSSARAGKANLGTSSRDIGTGGWSLPGSGCWLNPACCCNSSHITFIWAVIPLGFCGRDRGGQVLSHAKGTLVSCDAFKSNNGKCGEHGHTTSGEQQRIFIKVNGFAVCWKEPAPRSYQLPEWVTWSVKLGAELLSGCSASANREREGAELPDIEKDSVSSLKFYQPAKGSSLGFASLGSEDPEFMENYHDWKVKPVKRIEDWDEDIYILTQQRRSDEQSN
ncbi:uncharacterized protein LOC110363527 [Columba livia]|uniref:uncharacterized protein LOC110363527 n=1 Tax=Columba livia TaxID=8932 RepID=UPI0031BB18B6